MTVINNLHYVFKMKNFSLKTFTYTYVHSYGNYVLMLGVYFIRCIAICQLVNVSYITLNIFLQLYHDIFIYNSKQIKHVAT